MSQNAPYAGQEFQVRIEVGAARKNQPVLVIAIDRIMVSIDGTWQGLTTPSNPVAIAPSRNGAWTSIWQGNLNAGTLNGLSIMLGETGTLQMRGDSQAVTLRAEVRSIEVSTSCATDHERPVVVSLLLNVAQSGAEARVALKSVAQREVDSNGIPYLYGTYEG